MAKRLNQLKITKELVEIVPDWQRVKTTKVGYNEQYIVTIGKLVSYINKLEKEL